MDREIKLLHTADTHIGYRQYQSETRRQDFLDAFSTVINDAIEMQVDAVIHAGDLFDSRNPTLEDILETMRIISRLKSSGIPFLAIVGNHESKQNTQWIDLFEKMGIAVRLGYKPYKIDSINIFGIDSVPKSKIPYFDYSVFNNNFDDSSYNLLVMHQLMKPFAFGEWDCNEVIDSIPFEVHAILLGDYHKHEKIDVNSTWVTYCGSTERTSSSEREIRSYNIVTINDSGIDISRRNIPTRNFEFIPITIKDNDNAYNDIFNTVKEYNIENSVTIVEISGNPNIPISYSEVEELLLNQNALVPRIRDLRTGDDVLDNISMDVYFSDPDEAVKEELKNINLTDGGMLIDEIVRDPKIVKSNVDSKTEDLVGKLLENIDFTVAVPSPSNTNIQNIEKTYQDNSKNGKEKNAVDVENETQQVEQADGSENKEITNTDNPNPKIQPETESVTIKEKTSSNTDVKDEPNDHNQNTGYNWTEDNVSVSDKQSSKKKKFQKKPSSKKTDKSAPKQHNLGDYL